jgi:hypothetical protein
MEKIIPEQRIKSCVMCKWHTSNSKFERCKNPYMYTENGYSRIEINPDTGFPTDCPLHDAPELAPLPMNDYIWLLAMQCAAGGKCKCTPTDAYKCQYKEAENLYFQVSQFKSDISQLPEDK